jgi:hypothetical protein
MEEDERGLCAGGESETFGPSEGFPTFDSEMLFCPIDLSIYECESMIYNVYYIRQGIRHIQGIQDIRYVNR